MAEIRFNEEEFNSKQTGNVIVRILKFAKPHWHLMLGFMVAIGIVSFIDSYTTYLNKQIIDLAIIPKDMDVLKTILIRYGLVSLVANVSVFAFIYFAGVLGERLAYDFRQKTFNNLQNLSISYFNKTPVGWIISRLTSDVERVAGLTSWGLLDVTWGVINIITGLIFMFIINWKLALIVMIFLPIIVVIAGEFKKKIIVEYRKVRKINSKITGSYNENITGVAVTKAMNRENANLGEFDGLTTNMHKASFRAAWLSGLFLPFIQLLTSFIIGGIVWYGGAQINLGGLTIGGLQAFISYVMFMMWPIQDVARVYADMQQAVASAERIFSMMDAVPEIQDKNEAYDPGTIAGDIDFKNVSFNYDNDPDVLKKINLTIKKGENIALVGPTGGGKTTLVNIMCRFYEPVSGLISIGGVDYKDYTLHAIQSRLGIVLQTPHLFSGTILENIRYGRLDATDDEVKAAAKVAGADEFITKMVKGYGEEVGEGGNNLSVGQKQLISLARAVLAEPEIFIMDEATSSVDTITEAMIQKGMENIMNKSTSVVIAHRLSTIRNADRILVIRDGGIAEMGSHEELLRKKGFYYNLYIQQFREEEAQKLDAYA